MAPWEFNYRENMNFLKHEPTLRKFNCNAVVKPVQKEHFQNKTKLSQNT